MENETKPNTFINGSNFGGGINLSSTLPDGYILPDSYKDSQYPVLNFSEFDNVINTAYEYGFRIRFHVLVWHSQTPSEFFRNNYNSKSGYVNSDYMDGRMEYYIRNVINHIYNTPHGKDVVYCIDVVNEYFHNYDKNQKSPWNAVYYPSEKSSSDRTNTPEYVKKAFQIAYDELKQFGLENTVKLFYNDYNTYEVAEDIITMINYVNEDGKVCAGVGMQSHLDVGYPTVGKIENTIDAFAKEGFEIQITELDVTDYNNSGLQSQYYYDLIHMLVSKKKAGVNITGLTFWGLCDSNSWRRDGKPLLFSALFSPKDAYYKAIDAAKDAWK
jgi:endo-1,4-beta-xylanase